MPNLISFANFLNKRKEVYAMRKSKRFLAMFSVILCLSMLMGMSSVFAAEVAVAPVDNEKIEARITNCPNCGWAIDVSFSYHQYKVENGAQYQLQKTTQSCGSCGWSNSTTEWVFIKYV